MASEHAEAFLDVLLAYADLLTAILARDRAGALVQVAANLVECDLLRTEARPLIGCRHLAVGPSWGQEALAVTGRIEPVRHARIAVRHDQADPNY